MKRWNIAHRHLWDDVEEAFDGDGIRTTVLGIERDDKDGEWVRWDDVKKIVTESYNEGYSQALQDELDASS